MPGQLTYTVHYVNGESDFADSLQAARDLVMQKTGFDQAPPGLLPAEIWEIGPEDAGTGRFVERVT